MAAPIKTKEEIGIMRECGARLAAVMTRLQEMARPGVSTGDLDAFAERAMRSAGGDPLFKGYRVRGVKKPFRFYMHIRQ